MWIRKPKYPVIPNSAEIMRHDQLPSGAVEIARIPDNTQDNVLWVFVNHNGILSILYVTQWTCKDGQLKYLCSQDDFPLGLLSWFPRALADFQKPPIAGGMPAGAMSSSDQTVDGEMLSIIRALGEDRGFGGYTINNWSRCQRRYDPENQFTPHEVTWAQRLLVEGGLLELLENLAQKYNAF